jgi:sugar fermentation stimulation protein A
VRSGDSWEHDGVSDWIALDAPVMTALSEPVAGRFVVRPHRFAARVSLADGRVVDAHVANPGRLTGVLAPGCEVALEGPFPPPRNLAYSMLAARPGAVWIGTVTTYANRVFPSLLAAGLLPELAPSASCPPPTSPGLVVTVRREVVHGRSRFDFEVDGRFVEVKSVSLTEGAAGLFPDAVSARASKHCDELAGLARKHQRPAITFVAQREDIESVAPAETIDPDFAKALRKAAKAGVTVMACALRMTPTGATHARRVPVLL